MHVRRAVLSECLLSEGSLVSLLQSGLSSTIDKLKPSEKPEAQTNKQRADTPSPLATLGVTVGEKGQQGMLNMLLGLAVRNNSGCVTCIACLDGYSLVWYSLWT